MQGCNKNPHIVRIERVFKLLIELPQPFCFHGVALQSAHDHAGGHRLQDVATTQTTGHDGTHQGFRFK